jgi:ribosome biogenesis protein SSF1/2
MAKTRRKKRRTHLDQNAGREAPSGKGDIPKSFVMKRGKMSELVKELTDDVRHVMEPHTAKNLKESKGNKLKDFVQVSGPLGVSHFVILSATENSKYVKIAKTPRGPTLTFKVNKYTLAREVAAAQRNPRAPQNAFLSPPLVVLNNFGDAPHQKLATITFQNLFPPINVRKVKLSTCQRALLVDFDAKTNRFQFRHYSISAAPTGANRKLRKLLTSRAAPDLGQLNDVSEFFEPGRGFGKGYSSASDVSDSEGEDAVNARVDLAQDYNRVARANTRSRVVLQEIGPRMELELVKVEEGMCEGRVLFHAHVRKTEEEIVAQEKTVADKEALRKKRREEQEANVRRKEKETAEKARMEEEMGGARKSKRKRAGTKGDEKSAWDKRFDKKYNVGGVNDLAKADKAARRAKRERELKEGGEDAFKSAFKRGRKGSGAAAGAGAPGAKKGGAAKDKKNARPGKSARAKKR